MADINVERKSGVPIWMWILGLLLLGLLIWGIMSMMGRDDRRAATPADTVAPAATETAPAAGAAALPAAAQNFMRECHLDEGTRTEGMGLEHEYTVNCFEQLANSIEGVAQQRGTDPNVNQHVQTMRDRARQIRESPETSTQHANWTREAALAGASAIESMHQAWHAGDAQVQGSVTQVRQSAEQIRGGELQLDQKSELRSYFRNAGDALQRMAQHRQT
jgi:hypothetical protein